MSSGAAPLLLVAREDHVPHDREPLLSHEHVLGPAEADALRSELARLRGVFGRVGVRPHAQPAQAVGPLEDRLEVLVDRRRDERDRTDDDAPGAAVDGDHVAGPEVVLADPHRARCDVDREVLAPRDAGLSHPARHDGGVRRHPAVRGEHAARVDEAVDVVRRRLPAHEDDGLTRPAALLGGVGVEHDRA